MIRLLRWIAFIHKELLSTGFVYIVIVDNRHTACCCTFSFLSSSLSYPIQLQIRLLSEEPNKTSKSDGTKLTKDMSLSVIVNLQRRWWKKHWSPSSGLRCLRVSFGVRTTLRMTYIYSISFRPYLCVSFMPCLFGLELSVGVDLQWAWTTRDQVYLPILIGGNLLN
jgi:hypothetical protein